MAELKSLIVNGVTRLNNTGYAKQWYAEGIHHTAVNSDSYVVLAGGGYTRLSSFVIDSGGNYSGKIYDIPCKRVFSGNNVSDAPVTGWVSGLVLGSNWDNNHYQHYLVEAGGRWYATRSYSNGSMKDWNTFAYLSDLQTKSSWNYDDRYVTSLGTSGDSLTWVKNSSTNSITIPYATYATSLKTQSSSQDSAGINNRFAVYYCADASVDGNDGYIMTLSTEGYYTQIYVDVDKTYKMSIRQKTASAGYNDWKSILTGNNTYVDSSGKGYIENTEITYVNNSNMVDGFHASGLLQIFDSYSESSTKFRGIRLKVGDTTKYCTPSFLGANDNIYFGTTGLQYWNTTLSTRGTASTNGTPTDDWYHIIRMNHGNNAGYYVDLALCFNSWNIWYRRVQNGQDQGWMRILDANNSSVSKSGETLTVKINDTEKSLTNDKVYQTSASSDSDYNILFKYTANNTAETNYVRYDSAGDFKYNPSKNNLTVYRVNNIKLTYAPLDDSSTNWTKNSAVSNFRTVAFGVNDTSNSKLSVVRFSSPCPDEGYGYGTGIAFQGVDTQGMMVINYSSPGINFSGGNGANQTWWMKITGTSGTTYNLNNFASTTKNFTIGGTAYAVYTTSSSAVNLDNTYLRLSGGWMDTDAIINFKGKNSTTSAWGKIGYMSTTPNGLKMHLGSDTYNNTKGLYIVSNGYDAGNDNGGLAIDNDGVTVFGAGDTGSVFRVLNEDNVDDGAQFFVTKASGATTKYSHTAQKFISTVSTGTQPYACNSTTLNTHLNADYLDGYHNTSFEGYYKTTIDASALNANTWYPVVIPLGTDDEYTATQTRIRIEGKSDAPAAWNTRSDKKMAITLDYITQASSWGWTTPQRYILHFYQGAGATGSPTIAKLGQLDNSSTEYVYVRGGAVYKFYISKPITPVIKTSTYEVSSQSVAPTTTAPTGSDLITRNIALVSDCVTALGTNGNYVTWTKNGSANNLTVPFATSATTATQANKIYVYSAETNNAAGGYNPTSFSAAYRTMRAVKQKPTSPDANTIYFVIG